MATLASRMSARDQMAAMLDELMGPKRNAAVGTDISLNFDDPSVCKLFLVAFCPHEMFVNTKCDLGPCSRIHDIALREAYKRSSRFGKLGYEREFYRFCIRLQEEMKKKVERNKERCRVANRPMDDQNGARIDQLDKEISECLEKADAAGAMGEIEKSREFVNRAEQLKRERNALGGPHMLMDEAKPKEVCETCGCMLIIGDAPQRVEEHLNGKQHVGYTRIGEMVDQLREKFREEEEKKAAEKAARDKERESNGKGGKEKDKERDKSKDRDREDRKRRDHSGDRRSSRDDDRKERGDRDRDRDRERDRDRDRDRYRHRDDDRDRRHRSRSPHDRRRR